MDIIPKTPSKWLRGLRITTLCSTTLLAACSMSPGMYMGPPETVKQELQADGAPEGAMKTISPELIAQLRTAEESTSVPQDVRQLFGKTEPYRIGPGDILNIVIWNHPELALPAASADAGSDSASLSQVGNGYNVSPEGTIQIPFGGTVKVAGLTEFQARQVLTRRIGAYISDPQLTVRIQAYRNGRVYMDGEVHRPGLLAMNDIPMTLPEAINRAGGFTPDADRSSIELTRNGRTTVINLPELVRAGINPSQIALTGGDLIRVVSRSESKVYLMGDVTIPQALPMNNGQLTLAQALGEAGGVNPNSGNPRQIYVIRKGAGDQPEIYHLNASRPAAFVLASDFNLKPLDMVYVDPAPIVRWNRVISNLLPSYGAIVTTRSVTR